MDHPVQIPDREAWAQEQFGEAKLKDVRRTRRLVRVGAQMAANSSGSIPQQVGPVAGMKAAYRLFAEEDVTHERVCSPHFRRTREQAETRPRVFSVQDTMVLDYTGRKIEFLTQRSRNQTGYYPHAAVLVLARPSGMRSEPWS